MKRITSVFLALTMLLTLAPMNTFAADAENTVFSDMKDTDYYAQAATALEQLDILAGYPDGTFGAEKSITRAEMAAVVCRMIDKEADSENVKGATKFDDVDADHWASGYINIASEEGIINGDGNGKFRPEDDVKHEEAIKMVVCALGYGDDVEVDEKDWSKGYLEVASEKGISDDLKGTKGKASTRGDVAVMTYNGLAIDAENSKIPAPPVASVNAGEYKGTQKVKLTTTTKDAEIYYTTDGSTPTVKSTKYTKEISISKTSTLKAIAVKNGIVSKGVMSVDYTIKQVSSGGGGGGGSSSPSTPSTMSSPVFELIDDNGLLEFKLLNIQSDCTYTLMMKVNSQDFSQVSTIDHSGTFEIDIPENVGSYQYKIVAKNSSNATADSNIVNYIVASNGSGLLEVDSDNDGLSDTDEERLGTDKNKADTDGDGLLDGSEYYIVGTNPLIADTDVNDISDADEDFDKDGLTNKQEVDLGTDPSKADTDNDGLDDYEEVNTHSTNPINYDSDNDGLGDGDEILLGLNPLVQKTDGITLDSERKFTQDLSENNISEELFAEDNAAIPALTLTASGNINNDVVVSATSSNDFSDSRAIVGEAIDVSGKNISEGTISFTLQNDGVSLLSVDDKDEKFNTNMICKYNEDGSTEYLDTDYDSNTNSLSAEINSEGTYFVLNVKNLFDELGLSLPTVADISSLTDPEPIALMSIDNFNVEDNQSQNNNFNELSEEISLFSTKEIVEDTDVVTANAETEKVTLMAASGAMAQADIVFIIDTTGSMGEEIDNVKNNINAFVDILKSKGVSAGLALIDYQDLEADGYDSTRVHKNGTSNWFYNMDDYKTAISNLRLGWGGDTPECAVDALETARLLDMRASAGKIFVLVTDANFKVDNRYGIPSMAAEIELLKNAGVSCSVISPYSEQETYYNLYNDTNGIWANIYGNFNIELTTLADKIGEEIVGDGCWIYLQGPVPVPVRLDEELYEGSTVDTDKDGIPDIEELEGYEPSSVVDLDEIVTKMSHGIITGTSYGVVKAYKYKSNPSEIDTDGDGYDDTCDLSPKTAYKKPIILLHGRGDNSADCFGVITGVHNAKNKPQNNHYNTSKTENKKNYTDVDTHEITNIIPSKGDKTPKNLGYELKYTYNYTENGNLFAFNYPNKDMTKKNASKLADYLNNLATEMQTSDNGNYFYPTQDAKDNKKYEIVLIGHSNGGLVSRYFIENMWGDSVVDKLITIDTPHWGSGLADVSDNLTTCYPMDIDLNPENAIFGGSYCEYSSLNPFVQKKLDYINENQTDALNYTNHGDVKYYFLSGYDLAAFTEVPIGYVDMNLTFNLNLNDISNFGEYKESIKNSFVECGKYSELSENIYFQNVFNLKLSDGDNVVNNQSQLGLKFNDDKDDSPVIKMIPNNGQWMNMDTFMFHSALSHFHGQNQHRTETIEKIASILGE